MYLQVTESYQNEQHGQQNQASYLFLYLQVILYILILFCNIYGYLFTHNLSIRIAVNLTQLRSRTSYDAAPEAKQQASQPTYLSSNASLHTSLLDITASPSDSLSSEVSREHSLNNLIYLYGTQIEYFTDPASAHAPSPHPSTLRSHHPINASSHTSRSGPEEDYIESEAAAAEDRASCWSRAFFSFENDILTKGYSRPLEHSDLGTLTSYCNNPCIIPS